MPVGFIDSLDWGTWVYGAFFALSSGFGTAGAASFALYLQDPKDYNPFLSRFWVAFGTVVFFSAGSNFFAYIKQNPLPKIKTTNSLTVTESSVTLKQTSEPASPTKSQ